MAYVNITGPFLAKDLYGGGNLILEFVTTFSQNVSALFDGHNIYHRTLIRGALLAVTVSLVAAERDRHQRNTSLLYRLDLSPWRLLVWGIKNGASHGLLINIIDCRFLSCPQLPYWCAKSPLGLS